VLRELDSAGRKKRKHRLRRPVHDTGVMGVRTRGDIKAGAAKLKAGRAVRLKAEAQSVLETIKKRANWVSSGNSFWGQLPRL
jgi:hypothetical protein